MEAGPILFGKYRKLRVTGSSFIRAAKEVSFSSGVNNLLKFEKGMEMHKTRSKNLQFLKTYS